MPVAEVNGARLWHESAEAKRTLPGVEFVPPARHVELDSDHYVTLREPELLARTLLDLLVPAAPPQQ